MGLKSRASLGTTHSNYSHDWLTPDGRHDTPDWLGWVTATLGDSWFDPCPGDWTPERGDGLEVEWSDPSYVNHPGKKGSTRPWWTKAMREVNRHGGLYARKPFGLIWCAFSVEQLRFMRPCPLQVPGFLVWPRERTSFIWNGPTYQPTDSRGRPRGRKRIHGHPMSQPGQFTVWWSTIEPAVTPVESVIMRTGLTGGR